MSFDQRCCPLSDQARPMCNCVRDLFMEGGQRTRGRDGTPRVKDLRPAKAWDMGDHSRTGVVDRVGNQLCNCRAHPCPFHPAGVLIGRAHAGLCANRPLGCISRRW